MSQNGPNKNTKLLNSFENYADLISIVGSGYQSKWCSIQWTHQWKVQSDKQLLFLKQRSYNLTNTSMACQGLCNKIMQNYAKNLPQKLKHQKQFAMILKLNPCYTIMKLKHDLISIVGSGYQSKWYGTQWQNKIVFLAAKDYAVKLFRIMQKSYHKNWNTKNNLLWF